MCPHVVGYKSGREQTLFYRFGGESKPGLNPAGSPRIWRRILLHSLVIHEGNNGEWHTGPSHVRPQTCVDEIVAEVDFGGRKQLVPRWRDQPPPGAARLRF